MDEPKDIKPVSVLVSASLHASVKAVCPLRGVTLEKAYDQALRLWLDPSKSVPGGILEDLVHLFTNPQEPHLELLKRHVLETIDMFQRDGRLNRSTPDTRQYQGHANRKKTG